MKTIYKIGSILFILMGGGILIWYSLSYLLRTSFAILIPFFVVAAIILLIRLIIRK